MVIALMLTTLQACAWVVLHKALNAYFRLKISIYLLIFQIQFEACPDRRHSPDTGLNSVSYTHLTLPTKA